MVLVLLLVASAAVAVSHFPLIAWLIVGSLFLGVALFAAAQLIFTYLRPAAEDAEVWTSLAPQESWGKAAPGLGVVLVLGWGGATKRHLRRLAEWYNQAGYHVVGYTASMLSFVNQHVDRACLKEIVQQLRHLTEQRADAQGNPSKWHVHMHSNTGVQAWVALLETIRLSSDASLFDLEQQLAGMVFDSAPWVVRPETRPAVTLASVPRSAYRMTFPFVPFVTKRQQYVHWFWTPVTFILLLPVYFHRYLINEMTDLYRLADLIYSKAPKVPIACMYSDNDKLIPVDKIETFAKFHESRSSVVLHKFEKSAHVAHFRDHPETYGKKLVQFLASLSPSPV